jgi:enoyl-CoA hydratase
VRSQKALLHYWSQASMEAGLDRNVAVPGEAFSTGEPDQYMQPFLSRKQTN